MRFRPMNKLAIPSVLVATIMIAGIAAMLTVQDASTVHTTINTETDRARMAISTNLSEATTITQDKAFVLLDVHSQVDDGYILVATNSANADLTNAGNLRCGAWSAAGAELGVATTAPAIGDETTDGNRILYHCHVPDVAATVLVGLTSTGGNTVLPIDTIVTVTIDKLV